MRDLPDALDRTTRIAALDRPALFLDYDGTLTPIVDRPEAAELSGSMRERVRRLVGLLPVAVVSGRERADIRRRIGLDGLYYAGSHGFDIEGPEGFRLVTGTEYRPDLLAMAAALSRDLAGLDGVWIERKSFSVAVHTRLATVTSAAAAAETVARLIARNPRLALGHGKSVIELRPALPWHKGAAVDAIIDRLGGDSGPVTAVFVGDDITDEDAFRAIKGRGIGIVVAPGERCSDADLSLADIAAVGDFLDRLAVLLEEKERPRATPGP